MFKIDEVKCIVNISVQQMARYVVCEKNQRLLKNEAALLLLGPLAMLRFFYFIHMNKTFREKTRRNGKYTDFVFVFNKQKIEQSP